MKTLNHQVKGTQQAGDDVRSIDWRVTARTQMPHTKCFQEEKEKPVITLVDQRPSMFFGSQYCFKSVYACHLSALINWASVSRGDRSGGMVIGTHSIQHSRAARTQSSINRWLQQLTDANQQLIDLHQRQQLHQKSTSTFLDALKRLNNVSHRGSEIIIISDFYDLDDDCESLLFNLAKHHSLTFYWLIDPLEVELPLIEQVTFSDGEKKLPLSITPSLQQGYSQHFSHKKDKLNRICRQLNSHLVMVSINTALLDIYRHNASSSAGMYGTS